MHEMPQGWPWTGYNGISCR